MFNFKVDACDGEMACEGYGCDVREVWVMTHPGDGPMAYYGPTPPEYDVLLICGPCREAERREQQRIDEDMEKAWAAMEYADDEAGRV